MVGIYDYYNLRAGKPSKAVRLTARPKLALASAKAQVNAFENRRTKKHFIHCLVQAHGAELTAIIRGRAGLGDNWAEDGKPLLARDVKRAWDGGFGSNIAVVMSTRSCLAHEDNCLLRLNEGGQFTVSEQARYRALFDRGISADLDFFQAGADYFKANERLEMLAERATGEVYREREIFRFMSTTSLGLLKEIGDAIRAAFCELTTSDRSKQSSRAR